MVAERHKKGDSSTLSSPPSARKPDESAAKRKEVQEEAKDSSYVEEKGLCINYCVSSLYGYVIFWYSLYSELVQKKKEKKKL